MKILTWSSWGFTYLPSVSQGVTFRVEGGELVIARILHGGMVAQQGLLHVGDIIKEVNGQPVGSDSRALQELLRSASGSVILKILPSYQEPHLPRQVGSCTKLYPQHKTQGVAEPPTRQGHRPRGGSSSPHLRMPSLLPHDLCPEWNASPAPGTGSVHAQSRYQCLLSHVITDGTVT